MDLAKFLSLLDKSALFFVKVDKLNRIDPFEGHYTNANIAALKGDAIVESFRVSLNIEDEETLSQIVRHFRLLPQVHKSQLAVTFVNSWHVQDHESAAMWHLYVKSAEGIAVRSTYDRLIASIEQYDEFDIHVGMIKYIDYRVDEIPMGNILDPFMYKGKSFDYERELRALIWTMQDGKNKFGEENQFQNKSRLYVPVELDKLIDRVYVAPTSPRWMLELLVSVVSKYGLKKEVVQSNLSSAPVY